MAASVTITPGSRFEVPESEWTVSCQTGTTVPSVRTYDCRCRNTYRGPDAVARITITYPGPEDRFHTFDEQAKYRCAAADPYINYRPEEAMKWHSADCRPLN